MPVMTGSVLQNLSYNDLITWVNMSGTDVDKYIQAANQYGIAEMEAVEDLAAGYMNFYKNADGTYTITSFTDSFQQTASSAIDSNVSTVSRGGIKQMLNRGVNSVTGKLNITKFPVSGSFTSQAGYVIGSVGSGVAAVSTGISLGKFIDSTLYNLNPNFWDSHGMASLNPETWNSITNGDDSNFAGLFNLIMGLDPSTGNSQAYIDENAFAYLAMYMAQNGVFSQTYDIARANNNTVIHSTTPTTLNFISDISTVYTSYISGNYMYESLNSYAITSDGTSTVYVVDTANTPYYDVGSPYYNFTYLVSRSPIIEVGYTERVTTLSSGTVTTRNRNFTRSPSSPITLSDGTIAYCIAEDYFLNKSTNSTWQCNIPLNSTAGADLRNGSNGLNYRQDITELIYIGSISQSGGIEGISNQPNATLPDVSSWTDIPSTLNSLQQQYPDLWDDALVWDNVQPDGTNPQLTYIPVALPQATSNIDTKPTTGTSTQSNTAIDTDTLRALLTQFATQPETATDSSTTTPPENPVDTGTGNSPVPVAPSGSASSLWAVYHPTQGEINSFGAWLWSSNFVDQLLKVFQNPMDAIITLHKVFVTPVDAGTTTIHAGYLDSNVSSSYVTQQYVYVNCGSVDCKEYFGTVFDYIGTNVSLYLPFIGIVPLNVNEVMRSTINVNYGCDLFTGAILVEVKITRDSNDVVLYQYGGDGGVQYPVSGSRSGGFITGLAATIGAAASVATGGAMLPAAAAALGGSVMSAQKQVQHSGGFSGNSGAMGGKIPYLIIERPQTKVAETFPRIEGYPTNYSSRLGDLSGQVNVKSVHVEGLNATDVELKEIESLLKSGVLV